MTLDYYFRRFYIIFFGWMIMLSPSPAKGAELSHWVFPTDGIITDTFGTRDGTHKGIDIGGRLGTNVFAVDKGKVIRSYYSSSYGNVIFLQHPNGFETVYAHLQKRLVNEGDQVQQGQLIGKMGSTGHSSGVHLHFEIHQGAWTIEKVNAIDPFVIYGKGGIGEYVFALVHDPYQTMEVSQVHKVITYTIQPGDTLYQIAKINGVSIEHLQQWNDLSNPHLIVAGQTLEIRK
jgi:murein DD-endopeptidase MepM/ murein hydrolase activator NlpD